MSKPHYIHVKLRESVIESGIFASKTVDDAMKQLRLESDVPDDLCEAFFKMQRCAVKARVTNDADYRKL